jgi:ATP-dependent DNA ligase
MPPVSPMLAKITRALPVGDYLYEPKWDGFRCITFRDGAEVELGSRNGRPLTRYFPDVVDAVRRSLPERCVVDGEVVIAGPGGLDFDALSQRVHPADSRVRMLAERTPASLVAFDLLACGSDDLRTTGFAERRARLVEALAGAVPPVHLTPATADAAVATGWFSRFEGAGLDGVVAKAVDLPYLEDKRVMWKVKHERTADFVVAGFRWHKSGAGVGSLMLGLYDAAGRLHHVGVIGAFGAQQRGRPARGAGSRGRSAGGTVPRISASSPSAPSWSSRPPTSICRATGCATRRSSGAGDPTGTRPAARTTSSSRWCRPSWPTCSAPPEPRRDAGTL